MPMSPESLKQRIAELRGELVAQGRRVQALVEQAFESVFARDPGLAGRVLAADEEIDRVDVEIEKRAVQLLTDACSAGASLPPEELRMVLTIVKVNNELERMADVGTFIAELVPVFQSAGPLPATFRVLANSVIGILRDVTTAMERLDPEMARVVLLSEEAVGEFKKALARDGQGQLLKGSMSAELVLALHEVATLAEIIADHCTNVAEQVMYTATGTIVRHMQGHWEEVRLNG
jgi:phosphate transport system protein